MRTRVHTHVCQNVFLITRVMVNVCTTLGGGRIKNKSHIISALAISALAVVWVQSNKPQKKKTCLCVLQHVSGQACASVARS